MINRDIFLIFKLGSKTMFYSSLFFPKKIRKDIFILYAFVRVADNVVDTPNPDKTKFYEFRKKYESSLNGRLSGDLVIDSFVDLAKRKEFDPEWTEAFLDSMELDLTKKYYQNLDEVLEYVYGAAEVMGLYMIKVLDLDINASIYSRYLGRALQCINAIRDIAEDHKFGRSYLPISDLEKYDLKSLDYAYTKKHPDRFGEFIKDQITRYCHWQEIAEKGYRYMPKKYLFCIKTVSDMYNWTAEQILKNPYIVYKQKVKPSILKIILTVIKNIIDSTPQNKISSPCYIKSQPQISIMKNM